MVSEQNITYQAGRIAIGQDEIDKNGEVCVVLPQLVQVFEHSMVVDLSLKWQRKEIRLPNQTAASENFLFRLRQVRNINYRFMVGEIVLLH